MWGQEGTKAPGRPHQASVYPVLPCSPRADQYGCRVGWQGGAEALPPDCLAPDAGTQDY